MSLPNELLPVGLLGTGAADTGYLIERSLRFNSSDSAYLSRTPASAGNRKTWTWAGWVKRSKLGTLQQVLHTFPSAGNVSAIAFESSDTLSFYHAQSGQSDRLVSTTAVFRDASAWYHIVFAVDTTQSTNTDRIKVYVNGTRITQFNSYSDFSGVDTNINSAVLHRIGSNASSAIQLFDGYLADVHLVDGQALTPSSFTEVSATTGQLIPKAYSGSFGTNGFWLKFSDNSNNTAATLGKDYSGNGHNWIPTNLSVTAGAGNDSLVDTPTSYGTDTGAGGEVRGNYATLNPLLGTVGTFSNGNLDGTTGSTINHRRGTIGVSSGKWYWEITAGGQDLLIGVVRDLASYTNTSTGYPGGDSNGWGYYANNGNKYNGSGGASYGASYTTNDVIGIALDADTGTLTYYKNGVSQGQAFSNVTSGPFFPAIGNGSAVDRSYTANFGQRPFAYAAPSGFKALCTTNLPDPVVAQPSGSFDIALYTGNSSTQSITLPGGMSPDLVWVKTRSAATYYHALYDTVRGTGPSKSLYSNATDAEGAQSIYTNLTSFDSSGFSLGSTSPNNNILNQSGQTFVAWCWDAGSTTVTNTQGSITTSLRASASSGFSVISYTGTGSAGASIGHGLGVAPAFALFKNRSTSSDWQVYHVSLGNAQSILLQSTAAAVSSSAFNSTSPTSTVITLGAGTSLNNNGSSHICYAWAPVAGYSSFGSYTGNGSADGPFVFLGFRPAVILLKNSGYSPSNWTILDDKREGYNVDNDPLYPNLADAEGTTDLIDITSNGFKLRSTNSSVNANSFTFIYAAWASSPFAYARAR